MTFRIFTFPILFIAFFFVALSAYSTPITSAQIYAELSRWEGVHNEIYRDGNGWSVGLGHYLGPRKPLRSYYSDYEIRDFFRKDSAMVLRILRKGIKHFDDLPQDVQLACVHLPFTLGPSGFMEFKIFRQAMSNRDYEAASNAIWPSKWYEDVGLRRAYHVHSTIRAAADKKRLNDPPLFLK